ncbi:DUF484 family protein [Mannheimia massilioguelmaensis]|uniref:DUF484 family protein n=1 Tax=Mannheimia massilioguelmaensis TaxID=1604354 RepID=UPI0005C99DD0|nr:DUF484 family protein [Mannheimia massilioguelmaensis]
MYHEQTEETVINFLKKHPHFFETHLDLLEQLVIPHVQKGNLSLVEMQLERQRERIKELESHLERFYRLAIQDQDIFLALLPLQKRLANTQHFMEGVEVLDHWAKEFELQQVKILLFTDSWERSLDVPAQYWLDRKGFELIRLERLGLRKIYLGELTNKEKSLLFFPQELPVGSLACCLLGMRANQHQSNALLIFSARETDRFYNGQDTTFIRHIIDIVELHLHRWLLNYQK